MHQKIDLAEVSLHGIHHLLNAVTRERLVALALSNLLWYQLLRVEGRIERVNLK